MGAPGAGAAVNTPKVASTGVSGGGTLIVGERLPHPSLQPREALVNPVQIHLMMNHVPVVAPVVAALLVLIGLAVKSQAVLRVGLAALVVAALFAIPVYLTGEPVEEVAEKLPGVTERQIETHEDAAKVTLVLLGALGAASLVALIAYRRRALPASVGAAALLLCVVAAGQVAWTAHQGGQIRHTELSAGASGATGATQDAGEAGERGDDD
jgi:uncharacterized membrane protein